MNRRNLFLVVFMLTFPALFLLNCGQQEKSDSNSIVDAKSGGPEASDEECSITVPDPEPEDLSSLALITADEAQNAALAAYPGASVTEVELDNENGCLVYSVELDNDMDIKVDAGNGVILHLESDDDDQGDHEDEGDVDDDQDDDEDEDEDDDGPGGGK